MFLTARYNRVVILNLDSLSLSNLIKFCKKNLQTI